MLTAVRQEYPRGSAICCQHVGKCVSERDLNPYGCDLRRCSSAHVGKRITAGQNVAYVSEGRHHQIANAS